MKFIWLFKNPNKYLKSRNFREDKFSRILSKFAKLNPREIFPNGWFAKINPREIFKICKFAKINPREIKNLFLYIKSNLYKCITKIKSQSIVTVTVMSASDELFSSFLILFCWKKFRISLHPLGFSTFLTVFLFFAAHVS